MGKDSRNPCASRVHSFLLCEGSFEVRKNHFNSASQYSTAHTVNMENRGNVMQDIGYIGDGIAEKPNGTKWNNPEIGKSRRPPPRMEEQKMEVVLSGLWEWLHATATGIPTVCPPMQIEQRYLVVPFLLPPNLRLCLQLPKPRRKKVRWEPEKCSLAGILIAEAQSRAEEGRGIVPGTQEWRPRMSIFMPCEPGRAHCGRGRGEEGRCNL